MWFATGKSLEEAYVQAGAFPPGNENTSRVGHQRDAVSAFPVSLAVLPIVVLRKICGFGSPAKSSGFTMAYPAASAAVFNLLVAMMITSYATEPAVR